MNKNWILGAVLALVAIGMYAAFWVHMTSN